MKPGFKPGELCDRWGHGCAVYAGNVGAPVVFLMDCASSSHGMDPVDNRKAGHHYDVPLLRWRGDQAAAAPNFMRSGKKATATRDFLRAVLPSEAGGERWEAALAVVKARIASWAEYQVEELPHFDIKVRERAHTPRRPEGARRLTRLPYQVRAPAGAPAALRQPPVLRRDARHLLHPELHLPVAAA